MIFSGSGIATKLWRFISGDDEAVLLPSWSEFISEHTNNIKSGAYTTFRNTRKETEEWRTQIGSSLLQAVEEHCGAVIDLLGHTTFHSLQNVRNFSIPLRQSPNVLYTQK